MKPESMEKLHEMALLGKHVAYAASTKEEAERAAKLFSTFCKIGWPGYSNSFLFRYASGGTVLFHSPGKLMGDNT